MKTANDGSGALEPYLFVVNGANGGEIYSLNNLVTVTLASMEFSSELRKTGTRILYDLCFLKIPSLDNWN